MSLVQDFWTPLQTGHGSESWTEAFHFCALLTEAETTKRSTVTEYICNEPCSQCNFILFKKRHIILNFSEVSAARKGQEIVD